MLAIFKNAIAEGQQVDEYLHPQGVRVLLKAVMAEVANLPLDHRNQDKANLTYNMFASCFVDNVAPSLWDLPGA